MLGANDSDSLARPRPESLSLNSLHDDEYIDLAEPLNLSPGQIRSLEDIEARDLSRSPHLGSTSPMHPGSLPGINSSAELALAAIQYLPTPLIILSSLKTVILANEAFGVLVGLDEEHKHDVSPTQLLFGKSLSQVGVDVIEKGKLLWVTWDSFLEEMERDQCIAKESDTPVYDDAGEVTPTADRRSTNADKNRAFVHDAVVEVVITTEKSWASNLFQRKTTKNDVDYKYVKMLITIWNLEGQKFYSLSFTSTESSPASLPHSRKQSRTVSKLSTHNTALRRSGSATSSSSPSSVVSSNRRSSSSFYMSPTTATSMSSTPFPPLPPPNSTSTHSPSALQKVVLMKDALLDTTDIPIIAMWRDESLAVPNKAARKLFSNLSTPDNLEGGGLELLTKWRVWNENFTKELDPEDYPIAHLVRTRKPFKSRKIGMYNPENGRKIVFDTRGEAINDERGEFLAGIVRCIDITSMTNKLQEQAEMEEQKFELICDTSPQLIWTARPDGSHDWFSKRWYDYTGLSEEQSCGPGKGWKQHFHPDDMQSASRRWAHSLATGEPYSMEYRCLSKEGIWRWFIGRALPLRNKHTGKVEKWFGSSTDIHEAVESRQVAKRARQQLLSVLGHAQVTIFSVDRHRNITFLEGSFSWESEANDADDDATSTRSSVDQYIGKNIYEVFRQKELNCDVPTSLEAIEDILTGRTTEEVYEKVIGGRSYRTRFVPLIGKTQAGGRVNEAYIDGVIGVSMDITELKNREAELQKQEKVNQTLLANEAAAKEASRLKSQFLANMSHEIRTPIAGVIGLSELLTDMNLNEEQQEYAENIQRSASGLLTVINDILDLSKVESGRLDIEEVQFSLSVVVRDVSKMMSFVAGKKNLLFESDISVGIEQDLIVVGDPGRVRQIITNLLTNSIKFTSEGSVKFSVLKARETADIFEVKFVVEDSGIGIEEEVRKKLFKPFSQADSSTARRYGGTGLGLTISKNLVDLMHGRITLESSLGNGTTASFWIPFNKPQFHGGASALVDIGSLPDRLQSEMSVSCTSSEYTHDIGTPTKDGLLSCPTERNKMRRYATSPTAPIHLELPMSERNKTEILVVEDNAINQQIALKTIEKLGFQVKAVWNGKEALDYLLENAPRKKPNIILMDVQMPVIDGYRASHIIRHHTPYLTFSEDVPIVAMTASAIQGDKEKCQKAGMDDYLAKPVKGKTLEKMLVKWTLQRRIPGAPSDQNSECEQPIEHEYIECHERPTISRQKTCDSGREGEIGRLSSLVENEGERAVRRSEAEDQAVLLRYEKLIDAAGSGGLVSHALDSSSGDGSQRQRLTIENVERLEMERKNLSEAEAGMEHMGAEARLLRRESGDSEDTEGTGSGISRPSLVDWRGDSEMTITGR